MDPNANLTEQQALLDASANSDIRRRAELRRALQAWTAAGGFTPDWAKYPEATKAYKKWARQSARFQDLAR